MPTAVSASEFILERQNQNKPRIWGRRVECELPPQLWSFPFSDFSPTQDTSHDRSISSVTCRFLALLLTPSQKRQGKGGRG